MPLIESITLTNQAINVFKTITFSAPAVNYEQVNLRVWMYDLAGVSSAKTTTCWITKSGTGILSRFLINQSLTTSFTSLVLSSDLFTLAAGDVLRVDVVGGATDTANVDIIAELWGIPDLSALITTVDTVVDAIKAKTDNLPTDPADQSLLMAAIAAVDNGNGGALSLVYTVDVAGVPKEGATVKLFSDSGRTSLVNAKVSNVLGVCTFTNLVAGTYYLTVQMSGYEDLFDSEVVA